MTDVPERLRAALADRYRLERELGQGGMATVYLAEDLRHHRKVAVKVLRPEIAATVGAGRFAREIEVAARLQHPNILPVHDSGEADGFLFYVMPYVEGESLRDRLARGGELPIPDAVRILMEVADALSHAHSHGVVHRDIKPDNVMLRGRHALVADFGVAKAVTEATGQQLLTSTGVALGTPTYMAPEQAMADPHQDHRVDIYALGVLGYELLTGRAPFSATTAQEMLAAHVTAVPDPVEKYRATVSPALAQIIMRCLAKKPADRWQTAEEVLQHLEPLATPSGGTTPTQTAPVAAVGARLRVVAAAGGVIALAAVALLAWQLLRPTPVAISVSDVTQVTNDPGVEYQPAISPDGNEVAYAAGSPWVGVRLFVRSTANVEGSAAVRLGDTALSLGAYPSWSRDGQLLRFWGCRGPVATDCAWRETGKLGGTLRSIPVPARSSRLAWSGDGTRVAFVVGDTILAASTAEGEAHRLAVHQRGDMHSLAWSPDAKLLAYVKGNLNWRAIANVAPSSIWIVSADGGEPQRVTTEDALNVSPAWLDSRHLLFISNRDGPRGVYVVRVGPKGARGEPRLVPGIADPHSISYSTAARRLAFSKLTVSQNIWSYPLDRTATASIREGRPVTTGNTLIEQHDVSPDGRWIAYDGNRRGNMDLYKMLLAGGAPEPLTNSPRDEEGPRWSPDGKEIAFYRYAESRRADVMVMPSEGGRVVALTDGPGVNAAPRWSPDGLWIVFGSDRGGTNAAWVLSRDSLGARWHEAAQLTASLCGNPTFAPEGGAVACANGTDGLQLVSPQGGRVVRSDLAAAAGLVFVAYATYSRDGRTIYLNATHRDGRDGVWAIPATGGAARQVVAFDDPKVAGTWYISVGPDRLYLTVAEYASDIWVANLRW